jgi:hypothetical protein
VKRRALIVFGGWEGHEPEQVADIMKGFLEDSDFNVELSDSMEAYADAEKLKQMHLIVPHWTMGDMPLESIESVLNAVAGGVGIAGCHAGLCDAFRGSPDWQFMAGGQLVAHVGAAGINGNGLEFEVKIKKGSSTIVEDIEDFSVYDEQYYLHVDPSISVLATTRVPPKSDNLTPDGTSRMNYQYGFGMWNFHENAVADGPHVANPSVDMPVVWTKYWGRGRVFYSSLGHDAERVKKEPSFTILRRGFLWAAKQV